ncbi:uncharacterized protein N0V89_011881 [Didymosphaeria variabile]|uniref:Uncharacterized protein n=1 Tax=Didymosphaeria variabile TaxID=1932322 RepID=A0A9W8XAL0_9PLEO|nr:uncharacterized protein N0V89_011881 [Didymosphaeria variabile]KAJ4345746.1 hypothetical protein N0V89_011881 [Didymosphaeria variabile]
MSIPSYTAWEPKGMNGSQEGHMRAHFKQRNISSTSLEGMERPVRSFKSFIQTAPPNPTETDKALPRTPAPWNRADSDRERTPTPPSADFSPLSRERTTSIASWKAPAEWYNDSASGKSTHTPSPGLTPPSSVPRIFSPLLPEPSPDLVGMAQQKAWPTSSSPPARRLLPIYERGGGSPDLGPPGSPPSSPLPATPPLKNRLIENTPPPAHRRANSSPSRKVVGTDACSQAISRSDSTKAKAYASLGIDSPSKSSRTDREYLRGKKIRALHKGSPLVDDSWEDEYMDDRARKLSFSQDYHDLLADQYQELSVRKEEVLNSGGAQQVYEQQIHEANYVESMSSLPLEERDAVPPPLSWRKSPAPSTPRNHSRDGAAEQPPSPGQKSKHRRLSSFFNHHLGTLESSKEETAKKERRTAKSKHKLENQEDKALEDDLRFSKFFHSNRPIKLGKKQKKTSAAKASSAPSSPPQASPLIRLPGGLAVVRTQPPSPAPRSDVVSDKSPTSTHTRGSSRYGSDYSHTTSNSYHSNESPSMANVPIAMHSAYRLSGGSSSSHHSGTGHPLVLEASPPLPPSPPPVIPSPLPLSPPLSPETLNRFRSQEKDKNVEHRYTPKFIEKAREARRRRLTEARQDRLKRSIKVLGPTDPGVAQAGYVKSEERFEQSDSDLEGRLPGYMVGGPA